MRASPRRLIVCSALALGHLGTSGATAQFFVERVDFRITAAGGSSSTKVNITARSEAEWSGPIPSGTVNWSIGAGVRPAWGQWNNGHPRNGNRVPASGIITCEYDTCGGSALNVPLCTVGGQDSSFTYKGEVAIPNFNTGVNHEHSIVGIGNLDCPPPPPPPTPGDEPAPGCDPTSCSPIILLLEPGPPALTGTDDPIDFDIDADGVAERIGWTEATYDRGGFLVLDRDGDGWIEDGGELFGSATEQPPSGDPNGFRALSLFDGAERGGNSDGWISSADAVFDLLAVWIDSSHDGLSQPDELQPLDATNVQAIELDYRLSRRGDEHGNELRWWSDVQFTHGRRPAAVDVIFVEAP